MYSLVLALGLAVLGLFGNLAHQPVALGVGPVFGSIGAIAAFELCGPWLGMGAALVALLLLVALVVTTRVSQRLARSTEAIARIVGEVPDMVMAGQPIAWPHSDMKGEEALINATRHMAEALAGQVKALKESHASLEERVLQRTAELEALNHELEQRVEAEVRRRCQQEQLLVQQAKLAAMGEMLGAIAHQWRQPLNALGLGMQNMLDAYRAGDHSEAAVAAAVARAMEHVRHLSRTIDDFKDFFLPDRQVTCFDPKVAVADVLKLVAPQLAANDIAWSITCATRGRTFSRLDDLAHCAEKTIMGYRNEFEHVVLNLVQNARDAILARRQRPELPRRAGRIDFTFRCGAERVAVEVRDNGIGIADAVLPRIFEPYFTTKGPSGGTGIGLYMAKVIVEEHLHGRINVQPADEGALLVIELPVAQMASHVGGEP